VSRLLLIKDSIELRMDPSDSERNCGTQLLLSNAVRMRVAGECTGQQGTGHGPISQLSSRSGSRD